MVQVLQVDPKSLEGAAGDLEIVSAEFAEADSYADLVGAAVGHSGLAQRLRTFTDGWSVRRGEIEESVRGLAEVLRITATAFQDADSELAANVPGVAEAPSDGG